MTDPSVELLVRVRTSRGNSADGVLGHSQRRGAAGLRRGSAHWCRHCGGSGRSRSLLLARGLVTRRDDASLLRRDDEAPSLASDMMARAEQLVLDGVECWFQEELGGNKADRRDDDP